MMPMNGGGDGSLAIVSYDEKPGIQAIGTTAPDRPPFLGTSPTVMRDHDYQRHGTVTLPWIPPDPPSLLYQILPRSENQTQHIDISETFY
jgi:hypothetical protein